MDVTVVFIVFIIFLCDTLSCKKIKNKQFENLDECRRCKLLTDSFSHWLGKTSRGKHEGGDAAWEETKLKSYAQSEMRLVEIQEGLCSEVKKHQDQCYNLVEETESLLEQWWQNMNPETSDLYSWLCIETLKNCCPQNHFGESCSACPLDKDNKVCGGHGKCNGEGTRKGNGSCKCNKGYTGTFCEECETNYYRTDIGSCHRCHKSCDGCSSDGPSACILCNNGWERQSGLCVDVNECSNPATCSVNQYCINKEGSHSCELCDSTCSACMGPGPTNCTSCNTSSYLWASACIDESTRSHFVNNAFSRSATYFGLLVMTFITFRLSKSLASVVTLVLAVYISFSEYTSKMSIVDVISHLYF